MRVEFFRVNDFYTHAQEYRKNLDSQIDNNDKKMSTARRIASLREQGILL